jgi:hypothetical protein
MITWILFGIFSIWCIINRFSENGKVEGQPLGMPRGTVRAFITVMIVSFPFGYLIYGEDIPGLIISAIFIVIAFYFETRKSGTEKLKEIINEIKKLDLVLNDKKEKKPLYLPKYTVRVFLVFMLILIQILIFIKPTISFTGSNTLADVLLMIGLFIIGAFFRSIMKFREKNNIREKVQNMDASLSDAEIIEKLMSEEKSWLKREGKNLLSLLVLILVITALLVYTIGWDFTIFSVPAYTLTVQGTFLLLINMYYGFRD